MIGELLKYDRGTNNERDKHAATDGGNLFNKGIVGHVPLSIIKLMSMFLSLPHCYLDLEVTGKCTDQGTGPGCSRLLIKQSHDIRRFPMIIFVKIP